MMRTALRTAAALALAITGGAAAAQPVLTPEALFEQVSPSVWVVRTQDSAGKPLALGSAVVIGPGRLITNCHVLVRAKSVAVARENVSYGATLEFPDPERDLCQLKVANFTAPPVTIAPPDSLRVGARVYAIGNPRGLETTISDGLLSGIRRSQQNSFEALQITVPISSGSSGGGLFDAQGRLIGITTFMLRDAQNLNFALPANWIAEVPERAQAALAKRKEAPPSAPSQNRAAYAYRLQDRSTGNSREVVYRLDRTDGERLLFNGGDRVETRSGGVTQVGAALGGEFDLAMPPGGWIDKAPPPGSTWRLDYTPPVRNDVVSMSLRARAGDATTQRFRDRDIQVVRVDYEGFTQRRMSAGIRYAAYKASAWYSPDLARVIRFEAYARTNDLYIDEALELVDIRHE
jgi:hypothetical protein